MTPFEVVYGFNPNTPLDLVPLPINDKYSVDGTKRAEMIKKLHAKVRLQIEDKNKKYATKANKGRKEVVFQPGDWVWVHFRKERFPDKRKSKLLPRGDGPFQVLERINNNAYKLDLPGDYNVSATFNVSDLSLFDVDSDSRTNPFQEGGNDATLDAQASKGPTDSIEVPTGPITRSKSKQIQQAYIGLVQSYIWPISSFKPTDFDQSKLMTLFQVHHEETKQEQGNSKNFSPIP